MLLLESELESSFAPRYLSKKDENPFCCSIEGDRYATISAGRATKSMAEQCKIHILTYKENCDDNVANCKSSRPCIVDEFKKKITSSLIITRLRMTSTTSMALTAVWIVWMADVSSKSLERLLGSWTQPQGGPGCQLLRCFVQTQVFMRCSCGLCKLMIDR